MIYNINDSYYINQAIDLWLTGEDPDFAAEDKDEKLFKERCMPDD